MIAYKTRGKVPGSYCTSNMQYITLLALIATAKADALSDFLNTVVGTDWPKLTTDPAIADDISNWSVAFYDTATDFGGGETDFAGGFTDFGGLGDPYSTLLIEYSKLTDPKYLSSVLAAESVIGASIISRFGTLGGDLSGLGVSDLTDFSVPSVSFESAANTAEASVTSGSVGSTAGAGSSGAGSSRAGSSAVTSAASSKASSNGSSAKSTGSAAASSSGSASSSSSKSKAGAHTFVAPIGAVVGVLAIGLL